MSRSWRARAVKRGLTLKFTAAAAAALLSSTAAVALAETNKTISHVGTDGTYGYMLFTVPPVGSCLYNTVYINLASDVGRATFALATTGRATNLVFSRVEYNVSGGVCYITILEL